MTAEVRKKTRFYIQVILLCLLATIGIVASGLLGWDYFTARQALPTLSEPEQRFITLRLSDNVRALSVLFTSVSVLFGAYLTLERLEHDREKDRQQLLADQYSKAIDQLGSSESLHIRIGGIYSLERIAKTHQIEVHQTVMEVLASFIRSESPWPPKRKFYRSASDNKSALKSEDEIDQEYTLKPDIQVALSVICRRRAELDGDLKLDLSGVDLRGYTATNGQLDNADFSQSNFYKSCFQGSSFKNAQFVGTRMRDANFQKSNLTDAFFLGANICQTSFCCSNLESTVFLKTISSRNNFSSIKKNEKTQLPQEAS